MITFLCPPTGPLSKVRWVGGDAALVTLSSRDKVVMQWRHNVDDLALAQAMTAGGQAAIMQVQCDTYHSVYLYVYADVSVDAHMHTRLFQA